MVSTGVRGEILERLNVDHAALVHTDLVCITWVQCNLWHVQFEVMKVFGHSSFQSFMKNRHFMFYVNYNVCVDPLMCIHCAIICQVEFTLSRSSFNTAKRVKNIPTIISGILESDLHHVLSHHQRGFVPDATGSDLDTLPPLQPQDLLPPATFTRLVRGVRGLLRPTPSSK